MRDRRLRRKGQEGFTIVELLAAITVIAILASILFGAFNQNENAPRLDTAQMVLSQAFSNARAQAILKQNRARLIIQSQEPTNQEEANKFLRYFGVVVETAPDSDQWEPALKGETFQKGSTSFPSLAWRSLDGMKSDPALVTTDKV